MKNKKESLNVYNVSDWGEWLFIASSGKEAIAMAMARVRSSNPSGLLKKPERVNPVRMLTLCWNTELDGECLPPDAEYADNWEKTYTAREWCTNLGRGELALEEGGCTGPYGTLTRSGWVSSRTTAYFELVEKMLKRIK